MSYAMRLLKGSSSVSIWCIINGVDNMHMFMKFGVEAVDAIASTVLQKRLSQISFQADAVRRQVSRPRRCSRA